MPRRRWNSSSTCAAQQLVLRISAAAIVVCTFAGSWVVLASGLVAAVTVAVGVTLAGREDTRGTDGVHGIQ